MKKITICLIMTISVLLSGCVNGYSIFTNDSPINYNGSKWECSDPDMWFTIETIVDEEAAAGQNFYSPEHNNVGEIAYNGQVYKITCDFDGDSFLIYSEVGGENKLLLHGSVRGNSKKCTLKITNKEWDKIFNGAYDEITLYRTE